MSKNCVSPGPMLISEQMALLGLHRPSPSVLTTSDEMRKTGRLPPAPKSVKTISGLLAPGSGAPGVSSYSRRSPSALPKRTLSFFTVDWGCVWMVLPCGVEPPDGLPPPPPLLSEDLPASALDAPPESALGAAGTCCWWNGSLNLPTTIAPPVLERIDAGVATSAAGPPAEAVATGAAAGPPLGAGLASTTGMAIRATTSTTATGHSRL